MNCGSDVLIDLPTGAGKTLVYSPIVADAYENDLRALVLTATKQAQKHVNTEITKFLTNGKTTIIFGVQEYDCPILKRKAENWFCTERKDQCNQENIVCGVIQAEKDYNESNLVITNFSKFLLAKDSGHYDIIVLDDSHSFENAKEQAYQLTIQAASARHAYESGIQGETFRMLEDFLNLDSEVFSRCIPPNETDGVISQEYVAGFVGLSTQYDMDKLEKEIRKTPAGKDRDVCLNIFYFLQRCKKASRYQFFVRSDFYDPQDWDSSELISRTESIANIINKRFNASRIVFATATPGDPIKHATSCSLRNYEQDVKLEVTPCKTRNYPEIENWFQKLGILAVNDIGDTRQPDAFHQAINLTQNVLAHRPERALVLFKNYRDQSKANELLSKTFSKERLFFLDSTMQDSDFVEDLASRSQISLASASSTIWEGINIKDLRITVIVSPPFIRPTVGKKQAYPQLERRMLTRLQQGIGRIIRSPSDFGTAILIDGRFQQKYVNNKNFDKKLKRQVEVLNSSQVLSRVNEILEQGETN